VNVRPAKALRIAIAVAVFGFALGVPVLNAFYPVQSGRWTGWKPWTGWYVGDVRRYEDCLRPIRTAVPPRRPVGLLVRRPPANDTDDNSSIGPYFATQYVLSPSLVRPIAASRCALEGDVACGITAVDRLIVSGGIPPSLADHLRALGFVAAASTCDFTLFRMEAR
jgi:hypothetical protein